jgi:hypothetical protein
MAKGRERLRESKALVMPLAATLVESIFRPRVVPVCQIRIWETDFRTKQPARKCQRTRVSVKMSIDVVRGRIILWVTSHVHVSLTLIDADIIDLHQSRELHCGQIDVLPIRCHRGISQTLNTDTAKRERRRT